LRVQSKKGEEVDENDPEEDGDEPLLTFERRIDEIVQRAISHARASGRGRDTYKDSLVFQARKNVILEFHKVAMVKKCMSPNCGAYV